MCCSGTKVSDGMKKKLSKKKRATKESLNKLQEDLENMEGRNDDVDRVKKLQESLTEDEWAKLSFGEKQERIIYLNQTISSIQNAIKPSSSDGVDNTTAVFENYFDDGQNIPFDNQNQTRARDEGTNVFDSYEHTVEESPKITTNRKMYQWIVQSLNNGMETGSKKRNFSDQKK